VSEAIRACRHGVLVASLVSINEVNLYWARLVLGWVTVSGFDSRRRHFILVCNQPPRSTQPSTLLGTVKWVPAKGRWCSVAGELRQAWCNLQVKLCDPCLSAFEVVTTMRCTNRRILYFTDTLQCCDDDSQILNWLYVFAVNVQRHSGDWTLILTGLPALLSVQYPSTAMKHWSKLKQWMSASRQMRFKIALRHCIVVRLYTQILNSFLSVRK